MPKRFLLILYFLVAANCFGQNGKPFPIFNLKEIAQKENLCDPFITALAQDKDGLIWAGTNTGLNRLDGYAVKKFFYNPTKMDGLSNNTIYSIVGNFNNRLWIGTGNGICYYDYTTKKIGRLTDSNAANKALYLKLIQGTNKLLGISLIDGNWFTIDKENKLTNLNFKLTEQTLAQQIKAYKASKLGQSKAHAWTSYGNVLVNINLDNFKIPDTIQLNELFKTYHIHSILENDNILWITVWGKGLVQYNLQTKKLSFVKSSVKYGKQLVNFKDNNDVNWIVWGNEKGYSITNPTTLETKDVNLNCEVVDILIDKANTIWLGSNNGLFYALNKKRFIEIKEVYDDYLYPEKENKNYEKTLPWNLYSTSDAYFVPLDTKNTLLQFDKNWKYIKSWNNGKGLPFNTITGIFEKDNYYWISTYRGFVKCTKKFEPIKWFVNPSQNIRQNGIKYITNMHVINNRLLALKSSYAIQFFDTEQEQFTNTYGYRKEVKDSFPDDYIPYVAFKNDDCYFITQTKGFFRLQLKTGKVEHIPLPYNNIALTKLLIDDNIAWIASYNGLIKYNIETKQAKTYLQQDGLHNDLIVGMSMSKEKVLWVTTASSISCINTKNDVIKNVFIKPGISGGNAYGEKVVVDNNDNVVFGYENYLGFIDKEILNETDVQKKSIITDLLVNSVSTEWQIKNNEKYISLPSDKNNIAIHFALENAEENTTYYYKLNKEWRSSNTGVIELAGLENGAYNIMVANQPKDAAINDFIAIIIRPPFYKSWWFITLSILGLGGVLYAFFKTRTNNIRKQALLQKTYEQKLAESEMQTLRSQMNPHFMFNTLNSINSYIIQNKTALASEYLTTFSKLMRSILDLSKQETVPLAKEITALKMYIELEALRLENKFDYSISVAAEIDEDGVKIPSLIMQPFVENAIWHGLHNKDNKGNIIIQVKEVANHNLVITIEDDGIGRKAAASIKQEQTKHKSYGIDITINRVKLLNSSNSVTFTDLYDENKLAAGTRVTILLNTVQSEFL
jgi:ligand-binding sensor domain-containing protein/two-component sensor histidine kinase